MKNPERFWTRVHEALDQRRDPLGDAQVRAWIEAHPDDALALAQMRRRLSLLADEMPASHKRRARWIAVAAVLLVALCAAGWRQWPLPKPAQVAVAQPAAAVPRVHSFSVRVSTVSDVASSTVLVDARGVQRRDEFRHGDAWFTQSSTSFR